MKKIFFVICIFLLLTLIFTLPSIFHLGDKIIGDGGDNYQFLAFQDLARREFQQGQFPFGWTNYWRYPLGYEFGSAYDSTLLLISGLFLYQLTANAALVYNLSILLFLFLDGFLSYLLFRKISGSTRLGLIGGIIYGFSFYNLARMGGHPNLILSGCFSFFLYTIIETLDQSFSKKSLILFAFSSVLIFLVSLQYALILIAGAIFFLPLFYLFFKDRFLSILTLIKTKKKEIVVTVLSIFFVFMWLNGSKVALTLSGEFSIPYQDTVAVPVINFLIPNAYSKLLMSAPGNTTRNWIEFSLFFGYFELFLFAMYFVGTREKWSHKLFIAVLFGIFFVLSLGRGSPQSPLLPYTWLFPVMPFRGITEPGRFYVFMYLLMTYGIVIYLKRCERLLGKLAITILILGIIVERLPYDFYQSESHAQEPFIQSVKTTPAKAVLDLPVFWDWWNGNTYDLYSVYYDKPIVNGYIHWSGNSKESNFFLDKIRRFECSKLWQNPTDPIQKNQTLLTDLRSYGITTIVIHKDFADLTDCSKIKEQIRILLEDSGIPLSKTYEDSKKAVYVLAL